MKTAITRFVFIVLLFNSAGIFAQLPDLKTAANFVLFTPVGAVGSTGISDITGNVGSHDGAITGFGGITGIIYNADAITAQAVTDVMSAYTQLFNTAATFTSHTPAFGSGETLFAGVYAIAGAGSVVDTLFLDGQDDPNAIFIFKIGGALTTAASTTVILINGASVNNIFWIAEGAISMAASTTIVGTFIAHNGAVDMGDGSILEGRLLSTTGAISVYGTQAFIPEPVILSLDLMSFTGICYGQNVRLTCTMATPNENAVSVQRSRDGLRWVALGKMNKAMHTSVQSSYTFTDKQPGTGRSHYRLFQTDVSGKVQYGNIIRIQPCAGNNSQKLQLYPNPSTGQFSWLFSGNASEVYTTTIFNNLGMLVYSSMGIPSHFDLSNYPQGEYIVRLRLRNTVISQKIILRKN